MPRCLISFGANLGDARGTVIGASDLLKDLLPLGDQLRMSRLFQTPSVGGPAGQPPFVNAVAAIKTQLSPWEVWHLIRSIEQQFGRQRIRRWEARRIDLDILLYEDVRIWTAQLKVPHPRMCMRRFILLPAMDVAADWLEPVSQWSIEQLAAQVSRGKGSLLLVADQRIQPEAILEEVVRATHSRWLSSERLEFGTGVDDEQRSVGWLETADFFHRWSEASKDDPNSTQLGSMHCPTKLAFFLQPADSTSPWEDQHRELAVKLGLCDPAIRETQMLGKEESPSILPMNSLAHSAGLAETSTDASRVEQMPKGPRYLLATHDRAWAVHEIVSALDAMDCPVEPLSC